ncbi:tail fiber protein, partial [Serratia proteamaculans]|nr:tail fiber protein [Serratia proteamaculans]
MNLGFGNNVKSALAADITATQTVISVMPGTGNLFAALLQPDPALENHSHPSKLYAKVTLTDAQETVFEICHLTAVSADKLTVIRGQEGTTAKGWSLNNTIANFATRGSEDNFVQIEDLQNGRYLAATAGGTANALTVDLPSTFYLNGGNTFALHAPLLITPTLTNTGASTLMLTLSGHVVGTYPLLKGNNTALQAGDVVAKSPFMAIFNTEQNRFLVMNPTTEIG